MNIDSRARKWCVHAQEMNATTLPASTRRRIVQGALLRWRVIKDARTYGHQQPINTPALRRHWFHLMASNTSSVITQGNLCHKSGPKGHLENATALSAYELI